MPMTPSCEDDNAVRVARRPLHFLRRQHHGDLLLAGQARQQAEDARFARGVEIRGRLIEDEDLGAHRQQRGDGDSLLLAAGEHVRGTVAVARQPYNVQRPPHPRLNLVGRHAQVLRPECDLVLHPHLRKLHLRVLEDQAGRASQVGHGVLLGVLPEHRHVAAEDAAGGVRNQAVQRHAQRRLPRADLAQHRDKLPAADLEVDAAQNVHGRAAVHGGWIGVVQILDKDGRWRGGHRMCEARIPLSPSWFPEVHSEELGGYLGRNELSTISV